MTQLSGCPKIVYLRRRGQKNIRIRIKHDSIHVSAPWYCSTLAMSEFVVEREAWIRQSLQKITTRAEHRAKIFDERKDQILLRGTWVPMVIRHSIPESSAWTLTERSGRVDAYPPDGSLEVPRSVQRDFLTQVAKAELPRRFQEVAAALPFHWNRLFIRSQKTKWGTCSSKGNISLNWRLIMCPPHILEYLIIHELCHTVHMNHSKQFWNLVRSHYPAVEEAHRWLKSQGNLCFEF